MSQSQPFQHTGIDFAGPMYVRNKNNTSSKVYVCLFTCTAIRATHLELVEDQTTKAFLRAFRRFIGRRGVPETIISDNAKTFKAAAQDLETLHSGILSHTSTQKFLANNGIRWKFITERAPWWGGFYERLIGMTKRCLKKTIGKASLNMIELKLTRPIEKLYPLEIKTNDHDEDNRQTQELGTEEEKTRPPSRLAARKAALKIRDL